MVEAHDRHYPGDRTILTDLPRRALESGLEPEDRHVTVVRNTGGPEPVLGRDERCTAGRPSTAADDGPGRSPPRHR
ncbi:hypothetical protein HTZ77_00620 [Nonomuraea sp. SMC257]|uniref:Uncharacterized protein n=1 Tax=Nonomuraea montanisoli TaxID=2741721 RepID=A0A7Y6M112_9ACTN|nr:hypothetical protein [Nonomuraea montanisoli]NUW29941.1 hypothetical protein [Nonomuraea montanisoli]